MPMPPGNITGDPNFWPKFRTTQYCDRDGSPEGNLFFDRGQYLRHIYVAHEDLEQAQFDFCGFQFVEATGLVAGSPRIIRRTIPHKWPKKPQLIVQGVSQFSPLVQISRADRLGRAPTNLAEAQGRDTDDTPLYHLAEMSLVYQMPTYKAKADEEVMVPYGDVYETRGYPDEGYYLALGRSRSRYITFFIKPMSKMLTLPRGLLKDESSKLILESIAVTEHVAEFHYTWHMVPEDGLPEKQWQLGSNCVNGAIFDGRPAGTLLFTGEPELRLNANPITGQLLYDVTYKFHSLLIPDGRTDPPTFKGWNYIRKPTITDMVPQIFSVAGGVNPPQSARVFRDFDFRKFFRPDPL